MRGMLINLLAGFFLFFFNGKFLQAGEETGKSVPSSLQKTSAAQPSQTLSNINNWQLWIKSNGESGRNPITGGAGGIYPRGTVSTIFADGFTWGGIVRNDTMHSDLAPYRVGGSTYISGGQPGWIATPGDDFNLPQAVSPDNPRARVYRIRWDYKNIPIDELLSDAAELFYSGDVSKVTKADIDAIRRQYETDWDEWPVDLGAPFTDKNNNNRWEPGIDVPGIQNADQVTWLVYNDLDAILTENFLGSPPIGLEAQITQWTYKAPNAWGQAVFRRLRLINKSNFVVDSMYLGQWADPDLGNYGDDLAGCDSLLGMGFVYNSQAKDSQYDRFELAPASAGYVLLQGPVVESPGDTALFNFRTLPNHKNLPVSSLIFIPPPIGDPPLGGYHQTRSWYNQLRGFLPINDVVNPRPYIHRDGPLAGRPTKFPLNGDPLTGEGDIDGRGNNFRASDRRIMLNCGPFTMQPGDTQEVVTALVGDIDPEGDHISSFVKMRENVRIIKAHYGNPAGLPQVHAVLTEPGETRTDLFIRIDLSTFEEVSGCEAEFQPEFGSEPGFNLTLYDDGTHGDSAAGDGIWANTIGVENRKYAFKGDLKFQTAGRQTQFSEMFNGLCLRPSPELIDLRLTWENGQQDGRLNRREQGHIAFRFRNRDGVNAIDGLELTKLNAPFFNQRALIRQRIPPSAEVISDSLFLVTEGAINSDSVTLTYRLEFDRHYLTTATTFPVTQWLPHPLWQDTLQTIRVSGLPHKVTAIVSDPDKLTGQSYAITFFEDQNSGNLHWQLIDRTSSEIKFAGGKITGAINYPHPVVDGIRFEVRNDEPGFLNFQTIANFAGPLVPPDGAAADFQGFPSARPSDVQQATADGRWMIHHDNNFQVSYESFATRISEFSGGADNDPGLHHLLPDDYEIRFTETGGKGFFAWSTGTVEAIPFEIWNIGNVDDPGDDRRCFPWIKDQRDAPSRREFGVFNLWNVDHGASSATNDPLTDGIFWLEPIGSDDTGEAGYQRLASAHENNPGAASVAELWKNRNEDVWQSGPSFTRMVLVNWNGGDVYDPDFPENVNQLLPETGTVFRIITSKPLTVGDTLLLTAPGRPDGLIDGNFVDNFRLDQNFPNPFNNETVIPFTIEREAKVSLEIFNILGQRVKAEVIERMEVGEHSFRWNGRDQSGVPVSSGIYFYRITLTPFSERSQQFIDWRKMVLVK